MIIPGLALASLPLASLGGCEPGASPRPRPPRFPGPPAASAPAAKASEAAYRPPPAVLGAERLADGAVALSGQADPGDAVRLASPTGQPMFSKADSRGAWRLTLPASPALRLFGLAMINGERVIQSEGYLAVTPSGAVAQLRSGAGALVLTGPGPSPAGAPRIEAVDFDAEGAAIVSGRAAPGASLALTSDASRMAQGRARGDGRFSVATDEPFSPSVHGLVLAAGARREEVPIDFARPAPLTKGPYRAANVPGGWRIDWITPAGGLQTTVLPTGAEGGA